MNKPVYELTKPARQDLSDISRYIGKDNKAAALRMSERFAQAMEKLAEMPLMGHMRQDLTSHDVRFWPVSKYVIVYDPHARPIRILRVFSTYRDIPNLLH